MKKLLFVLAFAFIGQQAFSQMYIVTLSEPFLNTHVVCNQDDYVLSKIAPNGNITYTCLTPQEGYLGVNSDGLAIINQELNSIISQGYKLIETNNGKVDTDGLINAIRLNTGTTWYFAIP